MLQAARVFAPLDRDFADTCHAAATRAWTWLESNRDVLTHDPYYKDDNPRQEALWATAEMAAATGDTALAARAEQAIKAIGVPPFSWGSPQILGVMSLARSTAAAAPVARAAILHGAGDIAAMVESDPYGFSSDSADYYWESNEMLHNAAVTCLFAAELGDRARHRATAQRILDYILGCNALDRCLVTGHGARPVLRPYHWTMRVWGALMPGWTPGGANAFAEGADPLLKQVIERGTPPAKCYVDACESNGSWASNEGETSQVAALVLALGLTDL